MSSLLHTLAVTLVHMKELRRDALKHWATGLSKWQPRRLVLLAPLCISNWLPCTLHMTLHQEEDIRMSRKNNLVQVAAVKLDKGEQQRVHTASAETQLQARLWVYGESHEDAELHGTFSFQQPVHGTKRSLCCMLCAPDDWSSARSVVLHLELASSDDGVCMLSIGTVHWLYNSSSVSLRLYDARDTTNHVLQSEAKSGRAQLFTIDTQLKRSIPENKAVDRISSHSLHSKARVGVVPTTPRSPRYEQDLLLSRTFSVEAVGMDGSLEVALPAPSACTPAKRASV